MADTTPIFAPPPIGITQSGGTSGTTSATAAPFVTPATANSPIANDISILTTGNQIQPATPATSIAANQNTTTGSPFGSSAGVVTAKNQTNAAASGASATITQPSSTVSSVDTSSPDVADDTTDTTAANSTDTSSVGTTQTIDPSTLTTNAQSYITQQTSSLQSQLTDATTLAQQDYATQYSQAQASAQEQIANITNEMNSVVGGTQAALLASNPYASPNDPNVSGYVNAVKAQYENQINAVNDSLNNTIQGLQGTMNDAITTAKSAYASNLAGIQTNAQTMSDSESDSIASKQDEEQSKAYTALKAFTAPPDMGQYTTAEAQADPTVGPIMQLLMNGGMSADQALATIQNQSAAQSQPGMNGAWDTTQDMTQQLGTTGLTYGEVNNLATELNATGKMPSLGLGAKASTTAARQAILNRAYILNPSGAGVVAEQAYIKASTTEATRAASLLGPAQAAADKANQQISIVQNYANKVNFGTDILYNKAQGLFYTNVKGGNNNLNLYLQSMNTLVQEYGKVTSGSTGAAGLTDAGRQAAADTINEYLSQQGVTLGLNLISTEMSNTIQGYQDSINATTQNIASAASSGGDSGSSTAITEDPNASGNTTTTSSSVTDASAWPGMPGS